MNIAIVPIQGYNNTFFISPQGRIFSAPNHLHKDYHEMSQYMKHGWLQVCLDHKWSKVHLLVAQTYIPNEIDGNDVEHIDGDRTNNSVDNLRWIKKETVNIADSSLKTVIFERTISKKLQSWSKYGGRRQGLLQETVTPEWLCQACGQKQTDKLPCYMFELMEGEFIKVCTECQAIKVRQKIDEFARLVSIVRRKNDFLEF